MKKVVLSVLGTLATIGDSLSAQGSIMIKTLRKHGNSAALVLDKALLDVTGLAPDSQVEGTIHGDALTIRPVGNAYMKPELDQISYNLMDRFDETYRELAK